MEKSGALSEGDRLAFLKAAQVGDLDKLKSMHKNNSSILGVKSRSAEYTALHFAAENGHLDCVQFLLENGLSAETRSKGNNNAAELAKRHKHDEVLKVLQKSLAKDKNCPLTLEGLESFSDEAIWFSDCCGDMGNFVSKQELLNLLQNSDIERCPNCHKPGIRDMFRLTGAKVPTSDLINKIFDYVKNDKLSEFLTCIEAGCGVNLTHNMPTRRTWGFFFMPEEWATLLHYAIAHKSYKVFSALLEHPEIDVNKPTAKGNTPLLIAIDIDKYNNDFLFVSKLLGHPKLDVNKANKDGTTALVAASERALQAIVKRLLTFENILVNAEGQADTTTSLFSACQEGYTEIVRLLLQHPDIDVNKATPDLSTPLTIAIDNEHFDIVDMLLEHSRINVNQKSTSGNTALILAVDKCNKDLVEKLLNKGANPTIAADDGATAITIAGGYLQSAAHAPYHSIVKEILVRLNRNEQQANVSYSLQP